MNERAVGYLRVSGLGQADEGKDGFPRQQGKITATAHAAGFEIVEWFRDEGVSGKRELDDRPGLTALLRRVLSDGIKAVVFERLDRVARDLVVQELILRELENAGVRVLTADEGDVNGNDPTRKLIRQVLGALAEYDRAMIVTKLRAARDRIRREHGKCEGRKFFGDNAGESTTIARMRELRRKPRGADRLSFAKIASVLNEEARPTRSGKPWDASVVRRVLARQ